MDVRDHYYDVRKGTSAARRVVLNVRGLVNDSGSVSGRGRQAVEVMTAHERRSGTKFVRLSSFLEEVVMEDVRAQHICFLRTLLIHCAVRYVFPH